MSRVSFNNSGGRNSGAAPDHTPSAGSGSVSTRKSRTSRQNKNQKSSRQSSFKGAYEDMNGHVFQCYNETTNRRQFSRTLQELGRYASVKLKYSQDMRVLLKSMSEVIFDLPADLETTASQAEKELWKLEISDFHTRRKLYASNKSALFAVAYGQCSEAMQAKLQATENFREIDTRSNLLELLNHVKMISHRFDSRTYLYEAVLKAKMSVLTFSQGEHETVPDYQLRLRETIAVAQHYGAFVVDDILIKYELFSRSLIPSIDGSIVNVSPNDINENRATATSKMLAYIFIKGADKKRFGSLISDLDKAFIMQSGTYPVSVSDAADMLIRYKPIQSSNRNKNRGHKSNDKKDQNEEKNQGADDEATPSLNMTQSESNPPPTNQSNNDRGPPAPEPDSSLFQSSLTLDDTVDDELIFGFNFAQKETYHKASINPNWILLDSESTCSIFSNPNFLTNIRPCIPGKELHLQSNGGGELIANMIGNLKGIGEVYYHPESIANILSLAKVSQKRKVTFDSSNENVFKIHGPNQSYIKFIRSPKGLYHFDATDYFAASKPHSFQLSLVTTTAERERNFSKAQLHRAK